MISKKLNLLMLDIPRYKYLRSIKFDMKYFLPFQKIKTKSSYQEKTNYFDYYSNTQTLYSNLIFLRKNSIFCFNSNNKQKIQKSVQEDLETIKKFDLNDVKGFQNLITQIGIKYKSQPLKNIWIFQNNIRYLKEKKCEKNHSFSYYILLTILQKLQNRNKIQQMLPQVMQMIKFNDQKRINLRLIKSFLFLYYYSQKTPQSQSKAFLYLEDAYSDNMIEKVQPQEVYLIERKLNKNKLKEAQRLINSAVEILKKAQSFNIRASRIFKLKQQLYQLYDQKKNISTQQQVNIHYQKCYSSHTQVAAQIVEYMSKWKDQLDKRQKQIENKLLSTKTYSQASTKHEYAFALRWHYVTVLWHAYYSLMRIASLYNNHQEIIDLFKKNEFLFRSLETFKTSKKVGIYLFASKSFLALNRRQEALSALKQADQILFSINGQKLNPRIYIQVLYQFLRIISNQDRQDIHKIQFKKFKIKLIQLSNTQETFLQQFQLRKIICDQYLARQFYQKVLEQLKQMDNRFQQFRLKLSKQSQLNISATILTLKSSASLRQGQFHKCIEYANKAQNLIKINKSSEQFQNSQNQQQKVQQKQNSNSIFIFSQMINTNKSYAHINLAFKTQNIDEIKQHQMKCLQYMQKVFSYQSNQITDVKQINLMTQFQRFEQSINLLEIEWKSAQSSQKRFQVYKNIIGEFQYLIVKASQSKVDQSLITYYSLLLQSIKNSYQILLSQVNGQESDLKLAVTRSIDTFKQLIAFSQSMIQKSKDQSYNWNNMKNLFIGRLKLIESHFKDLIDQDKKKK